jgi:hypothetical protein
LQLLGSHRRYRKFGAQEGDIGAGVSTALGSRQADHLLGIHLNFMSGSFQPFLRPDDVLAPADDGNFVLWVTGFGYYHIEGRMPVESPALRMFLEPFKAAELAEKP